MTLDPIYTEPLFIQFHAGSALIALLLGPINIYRQRRDRLHRTLGYVWVIAMVVASLTAIFIPSFDLAIFGHFGPIHGLILLALWSIWQGMRAIWRGDIEAHRLAMAGLYWRGMSIAGLLTLLPGRVINRVVFPDTPELGYAAIALGGMALIWYNVRGQIFRPVAG